MVLKRISLVGLIVYAAAAVCMDPPDETMSEGCRSPSPSPMLRSSSTHGEDGEISALGDSSSDPTKLWKNLGPVQSSLSRSSSLRSLPPSDWEEMPDTPSSRMARNSSSRLLPALRGANTTRRTFPIDLLPKETVVLFSIDGGGIRGLIPATFLAEIERRTNRPIWQHADLLAGTSTGGLLSLGLAVPSKENPAEARYSAAALANLYRARGSDIFVPKWGSFGGLFRTKYKATPFEELLQSYFGEGTMLSSSLTDVMVTTYDIERQKPKFYKSRSAAIDPLDNFLIWQIARQTSAAPTFFKPAKAFSAPDASGYRREIVGIDGGVGVTNNPVMCAYVEALSTYPDATDFIVASFGTGRATVPLSYDSAKNMGLVGWGRAVTDICIDGTAAVGAFQVAQIARSSEGSVRTFRFQPEIQMRNAAMDDIHPDNLRALEYSAERVIHTPEFDNFIRLLGNLPPVQERRGLLVEEDEDVDVE